MGTTITKEDILEHIGLEICGIAFTSNEPAVLVNAFGPISYCKSSKHIKLFGHTAEQVDAYQTPSLRCKIYTD